MKKIMGCLLVGSAICGVVNAASLAGPGKLMKVVTKEEAVQSCQDGVRSCKKSILEKKERCLREGMNRDYYCEAKYSAALIRCGNLVDCQNEQGGLREVYSVRTSVVKE